MEDIRLEALKQAIQAASWSWRPGKAIPYGTQLIVNDGVAEATLDFYPKRGRSVVGGAPSALRRSLEQLTASSEESNIAPARSSPAPFAGAHIGLDESGKGDWYGSLIVAAVYIEPGQATELRRAGVRDSKELDEAALRRVAAQIVGIVPESSRRVTVLEPAEYNRRYALVGNINLLLAELYAETAIPVRIATGATQILCDQFAQSPDRLNRSFAAAGLPRPTQMHHAEAASIAVAAASVLASASFAAELARLGSVAGLRQPLPAGSSAIRALSAAARHILAREGPEGLAQYAKLNFRPVQEFLARNG